MTRTRIFHRANPALAAAAALLIPAAASGQAAPAKSPENSSRSAVRAGLPGFALPVPVPELGVAVPTPEVPVPAMLRDALAEARCAGVGERLEAMEASILGTKARYWAARMRAGRASGLISNPGSEIRDPELRRSFYRLMSENYRRKSDPPARWEVRRMKDTMRRMHDLIESCGGEAPELRRAIIQTQER